MEKIPSCRLITTQVWSAHEECCYESLFLPAGTTQFDIQYCPEECIQCHGHDIVVKVVWDDKHGHNGTASKNDDGKTYKVYTIVMQITV